MHTDDTAPLGPRFAAALDYAVHLHRHQLRKETTIPYASHLLMVTALALEHGADEDEAIAALLHDAIEDQGGARTGEEIRARFGDTVHAIVVACTDAEVQPKPPWRARKETYLAHVPEKPEPARLVSVADKLANARAILDDYRHLGEALWGRFNGGRDGTLWYYRGLVTAFRSAEPGRTARLVEELDRVVSELEDLAGAR